MGILLTTIAAAATWVVLLSLGVKPFDALLVGILMVLIAATAHLLAPALPGTRRRVKPTDHYTPR
jgi:Mn2+/Fe2+ NRAMP family transporter